MATSSGSRRLEEGTEETLDFSKLRQIAGIREDVLPVVVQDSGTKEVLILAYINRLALDESLKTGIATFWSTSRNELWVKGATSGNARNRRNPGQLRTELRGLSRNASGRRSLSHEGRRWAVPDRLLLSQDQDIGRTGVYLTAVRLKDKLPFLD